ncbi:hypothetical protein [Rathayibacter sp. VKM Ac-2927]|uniref:hypothetical protein n=1 Tax=Rathayibacter sp. VKM Ac-2927 TaxID=2929478 RepID=UPI001FB1D941|nr:hypothetical protein [Rathayibacter sp. VKM Ac-2927]MCJ1687457.1 hypothetical protein [Rathayibacter sp. VKM Ac-2927]
MVRSASRKTRPFTPRLLVLSVAVIGGLAGVTGCSTGAAEETQASTPPSAPSASTSTPASSATAAPASPSASAPSSAPPASSTGCIPNDTPVPAGVATAEIGDVDGDGRADQAFYDEDGGFDYGIRTASGATFLQQDTLAGPATHRGWTVAVSPTLAATVLSDGRTAALFAFTDCAFVTPVGVDGEPYRFVLAGFGDAGTGVTCGTADADGHHSISGVLAAQDADGRYSITSTRVALSADGRTATNGAVTSGGDDLAQDDPAVVAAMTATCDGVASVQTSGE